MDVCLPSYEYVFRPDVLRGHVAFITGGGSGICFTIAEIFMRHQCDTIIASRNFHRVQQAAEQLENATGRRCLPLQVDVRKPETVLRGVNDALGHYGGIDILVNGAAGNDMCPAGNPSFNGFKTVLEIDTMGTFNTSKVVYDKYMKHHGGVIINILACLPYQPPPLQIHATAATAAIDSMTMTMCNEWGHQGIRVVGIAPGPIADTEGMRKLGGSLRDHDKRVKNTPYQWMGAKQDIAECAVFVASPAAKYITGHTVVVDGGHWMTYRSNLDIKNLAAKL